MLCPNCGYLITKRTKNCPKCNHVLPDETGEWSEESSVEIRAPEEEPAGDVGPSVEKTGKQEDEEKPSEKPAAHEGEKKTSPPVEKEVAAEEEIPPSESPEPGPLFQQEEVVPPKPDLRKEREKDQPPQTDRKGEHQSEKPVHKVGPSYTVPEPYQAESATFSSELGTDWIDKYARSHVEKIPERAGLGVRFWVGLLDWMLLLAVGVVVLVVGRLVLTLLDGTLQSPWELLRILGWPAGGLWFVLVVFYFTIFVGTTGQTPGSLAMDVRVIDVATGRPPSIGKAFLRAMAYLGGMAALGAGSWKAILSPERLTWHDQVAGTRVVPVLRI